ncbi:hypothetical protein Bb109J_c0672 [Bdellovibrio bacteriovorus]|uniref:hypothetical protein n=1 Tax=Bdellovibrio bacteriovorus TaxID=959 RepID=UPI000A7721E7|nr:hypothetical protein [Bdellovibrio bacteriovorus]BEV67252.1 hypothetical protein Bb109J_c0672 [Bdellovibrio bacteriovorus]
MSLVTSALVMACVVYGPAQSRDNVNNFKILQPLQIQDGRITTLARNQVSQFESYDFKIEQYNLDQCPNSIIARDSKGRYAAVKGMYRANDSTSQGVFVFDDGNDERFKALIHCPYQFQPCDSGIDVISGWEIF